MIVAALSALAVPIDSIKPDPQNVRRHPEPNRQAIKKSLQGFQQRKPIVVNKRTMIIEAGNGLWQEMKSLGAKEIAAVFVDDTDEQAKAYGIMDNRSAELAEWDIPALKDVLQDLDNGSLDMDLTGFDSKALEDLMTQTFQPKAGLTDDDDVPEPKETICKTGDLWILGNHRVLCGDSTRAEDVARLMNGEKADICFTSPPYNVGRNSLLSPHQKGGTKYVADTDDKSDDEYLRFLSDCVANALEHCDFVFLNVQSLAGNKTVLIDLLWNLKTIYADSLIWDKQNAQPAMAPNVLNSQFEYIHVFSQKANRAIGVKDFRGTVSNVISIHKKASEVKEHNDTFPVALAEFVASQFSVLSVLDPFLGSGSTLIACEKLNRRCFGMEIDEHYADVIVERWQQFTGLKAQRG